MYLQFFSLHKNPFNMTPDPGLLFMPPQHREALAGLVYAILNRKGFAVLIGDAGTGKTTLLARTLQCLPVARFHSSVVLNPTVTPAEFLEMLLLDFGITDIPPSKAHRLVRLQRMLLEDRAANRIAALIIDEAHKLSPELLEEVRLLSNFELADEKLLQIVLSGQDELAAVLNENRMRQLKQRIAVRLSITALAGGDIEQYIRFRWTKSGGTAEIPFSSSAVQAVAEWSQGIPRLINAVCDNALTAAFGRGSRFIDAAHIAEVALDLDLKPASKAARADAPVPAEIVAPAFPGADIAPIRVFDSWGSQELRPSWAARMAERLGWTGWIREHE